MKILAINSIKYNNQQLNTQNSSKKMPQHVQNGVYNPIYYRDYNIQISFGKRSPEEFYSADFNRENMPKRMKAYLNEKYEERSKIAPIQIMQEAYEDLNAASTVEDIKELFPSEVEPKFSKLKPANYANANQGILKKIKDIKAMQENPEPLFKDGCDDLTTYLVKKIYLEGKTVKEIDKDFANDINEVYELAARVPDETKKALGKNESAYFSHSTVYGLGIRFPELPFWNSFISTRDDYARTVRVKNKNGEFVNADSLPKATRPSSSNPKVETTPEPPRKYKFNREKVKKLTDTIVNSQDDAQRTLKNLTRKGRDIEEPTFLQKYWSQIMTLATEKIHLSEEMISFNEGRRADESTVQTELVDKLITGERFTKREKTPFKIFWSQNPWLKAEFSSAITDCIMQFTDAYGADGNNSYFQALLKDIENTKPNREEARRLHDLKQAEYDALGQQLLEEEQASLAAKSSVQETKEAIQDIKTAEKSFTYKIDGHTLTVPVNLEENILKQYDEQFFLFPRKLYKSFMQELNEVIKDNPNKFYISCAFEADEKTPEINAVLYNEEELRDINEKVIEAMETKHNTELESCRLSFFEYALKHNILKPEEVSNYATEELFSLNDRIHKEMSPTGEINSAKREIQEIFTAIHRPLTKKEESSIQQILLNTLKTYNMNDASKKNSSVPAMIHLLSRGAAHSPRHTIVAKEIINNKKALNHEGPCLRYILKKDGIKEITKYLCEHALRTVIFFNPQESSILMTTDMAEFARLYNSHPKDMQFIYEISRKVIALSPKFLR